MQQDDPSATPRPSPSMPVPPLQPSPAGGAPQLGYATPPPAGLPDLRAIAVRQKAVMYCILAYAALVGVQFLIPRTLGAPVAIGLGLLGIAVSVTAAVFVFMLALSLYSTGTGVLLGILTLIPCVGLIVLLIINGKATTVLTRHGIKVGLMGAKTGQIPGPGQGHAHQ